MRTLLVLIMFWAMAGVAQAAPSVAVVAEATAIVVQVTDAPGGKLAWAGVFDVGAPSSKVVNGKTVCGCYEWKRLTGTHFQATPIGTQDTEGKITEAMLAFNKPAGNGPWEVRFFDSGYTPVLATSVPILTTAPFNLKQDTALFAAPDGAEIAPGKAGTGGTVDRPVLVGSRLWWKLTFASGVVGFAPCNVCPGAP